MYIDLLLEIPLFAGIAKGEIESLLTCANAEEMQYEKGAFLYHAGDFTNSLGILLSGTLSIENNDLWGNRTILSFITPGNVFAETYACLPGEPLLINVVANTPVCVLSLDMSKLLQPCQNSCTFHQKLIQNLLTISVQKNLHLSRRSFHTAAKTIRGRLLSYLSDESRKWGSYEFDIPFNRQQLADYLNLDRSALSNELGKMVCEGILTTHRSHFQLNSSLLKEEGYA